jgi:hypothetical protein
MKEYKSANSIATNDSDIAMFPLEYFKPHNPSGTPHKVEELGTVELVMSIRNLDSSRGLQRN